MSKKLRPLALLLAILLLLPTLASCADAKMKKPIGTCVGHEVPYAELRYVTLLNRTLMENAYGKDIWTDPAKIEKYRPELEEIVWSNILNNYAVLALCAQYGLTADRLEEPAIQEAVQKDIDEAVAQYGSKQAFRQALAAQFMTEDFVRFALAVAKLENELLYVLTDDLGVIFAEVGPFLDWLEAGNCVRVQHVYIRNDASDSVEENRALAQSVRTQLMQGVDIGSFINSTVNEDTSNTAPYYIVRDVYVKEMEDAAFNLHHEGDVSQVIEVDQGFYVLVRMEDSEINRLTSAPSLLQSYQWAKLEAMVEEVKATLSVELNDYGKSLDLVTLK